MDDALTGLMTENALNAHYISFQLKDELCKHTALHG